MKKGDHIYVDLGSSKQHGIYCGDDRVIYWAHDASNSRKVQSATLDEFSKGKKIKVRKYRHKCKSMRDVIARAKRRLSERKPKYQFADSKAFAMYCKTGLKVGDHIQVDFGCFSHHGIYVGNDLVIHYEKENVCHASLRRFTKSRHRSISIRQYKKCSSVKKTIQRANRRLGEHNYHLLFNNCEHFATWCKTKQHRSKQLEDPIPTIIKFITHFF